MKLLAAKASSWASWGFNLVHSSQGSTVVFSEVELAGVCVCVWEMGMVLSDCVLCFF